jgi:transcriptional regulator, putative
MQLNKIKEALKIKRMSQKELSVRLGKSFNMVNLYISNKVQPPIPTLCHIAEILDVDVRELLVSNKNKQ